MGDTKYDEENLRRLLAHASEEYLRRALANQTKRDTVEAHLTLSRHINPDILESIRPISRSTDSIWGNILGEIAIQMAFARYGNNAPHVWLGRGVSEKDNFSPPSVMSKQYIAHRVDRKRLVEKVGLIYNAKNRLDRPGFEQLRRDPPLITSGPILFEEVDLVYRNPSGVVRVFEIKASGQLDIKNGPSNVHQLLVKTIMCDAEAEPTYGVAQREIDGSTADRDLPGAAFGQKQFWELLLPNGVDFARFDILFAEAGRDAKQRFEQWIKSGAVIT